MTIEVVKVTEHAIERYRERFGVEPHVPDKHVRQIIEEKVKLTQELPVTDEERPFMSTADTRNSHWLSEWSYADDPTEDLPVYIIKDGYMVTVVTVPQFVEQHKVAKLRVSQDEQVRASVTVVLDPAEREDLDAIARYFHETPANVARQVVLRKITRIKQEYPHIFEEAPVLDDVLAD